MKTYIHIDERELGDLAFDRGGNHCQCFVSDYRFLFHCPRVCVCVCVRVFVFICDYFCYPIGPFISIFVLRKRIMRNELNYTHTHSVSVLVCVYIFRLFYSTNCWVFVIAAVVVDGIVCALFFFSLVIFIHR